MVALATLYCHLSVLTQQQVLKVVEERPNRGTAALLSPDDLAHMSQEEHLQTFMIFLVSLLTDGFGYGVMPFFLSNDEFGKIVTDVNAAQLPHLENSASPERRRRILAMLTIPGPKLA